MSLLTRDTCTGHHGHMTTTHAATEYDPTYDERDDLPAHECELEAVESATYPTRSGAFTVTTSCDVCGRVLGVVHDSVL